VPVIQWVINNIKIKEVQIMTKINMHLFKVIILSALFFVSLSGCRTAGTIFIGNTLPGPGPSYDEGPPPWAPAHGNRAKHTYRYYPYHGIYFEERTGVYFYMSDGRWQMSANLPVSIRITVKDFVTLDMDSERPYDYHNDVVKRYPPGQQKNKGKGRDNDEDSKGKKRGK
jgi:hypothetical protein